MAAHGPSAMHKVRGHVVHFLQGPSEESPHCSNRPCRVKQDRRGRPRAATGTNWRTERFANGVNEWCNKQQIPLQIVHFGSLFRFVGRAARNIGYALIERGVYVWEGGSCFLSTAHSTEDLAVIAEAVKDALGEMQDGR